MLGIDRGKPALEMEIPTESATTLLCENRLDASVWIIGHPSKLIQEQLNLCDLVLSGAAGPALDEVMKARPYLLLPQAVEVFDDALEAHLQGRRKHRSNS